MSAFLRFSTWSEVVSLFPSEQVALANARGWADRYLQNLSDPREAIVTLESWSHEEIGAAMDRMSAAEPRMTVDIVGGVNNASLAPRVDGLPVVVVKFGDRYGMIDGKHRANQWKNRPGRYAVLVVHA